MSEQQTTAKSVVALLGANNLVSYTCICGQKTNAAASTWRAKGESVLYPSVYCSHDPDAESPFSIVLEEDPPTNGRLLVRLIDSSQAAWESIEAAAVLFEAELFTLEDSTVPPYPRATIYRRGRDGQPVPVTEAWMARELTSRCVFVNIGWNFEREIVVLCPQRFASLVLIRCEEDARFKHPMIGDAARNGWPYGMLRANGWTDAQLIEHGYMKPSF